MGGTEPSVETGDERDFRISGTSGLCYKVKVFKSEVHYIKRKNSFNDFKIIQLAKSLTSLLFFNPRNSTDIIVKISNSKCHFLPPSSQKLLLVRNKLKKKKIMSKRGMT